ncbi:MAG TPA: gliding motility-associated C-terminal domain-containing protein [Flavobacterium sp.]|nr:gliding motility-associated C-terminal domain-containing protein [Flavobacterium sp.]
MKTIISVITIFLCTIAGHSQSINPSHIINLCSNQTVQGTSPTTNVYNNLMTPCSTLPLSTSITLYYVEIESGTTFEFTVSPNAAVDFDFASWKNPNLANVGIGDRGSQNTIVGITTYDVGLSLNEPVQLCEGAGVAPPFTGVIPGMVRYYNVQPGDGILIAIDHWESSVVGYDLSFGGDAILNCNIVGRTFEACDYDHDGKESFDLYAVKDEINNINNTFIIDFFEDENDANNLNATNVLDSPYVVSTSESPKTVYARFRRTNGILARVTEIEFIVHEVVKLPDYELVLEKCNFENDGKEVFDLTELEIVINQLNPGKTVQYRYYENEADAQSNANNYIIQTTAYETQSKIIYANISMNDKCPLIVPVELKVQRADIKPKSLEYSEFCAEVTTDGLVYDLEKTFPYFIEEQNPEDFIISVHLNQTDAQQNSNPVSNTKDYKILYNHSEQLFLRITNQYGCTIFSEIILNSRERFATEDRYNSLCEPYHLPSLPFGYRYFTEPNGQGEILYPGMRNSIIYGKRTIYIHGNMKFMDAETPEFNLCSYDTSLTIYNNDCEIPRGISPNGDGLNDQWDLIPFGIIELKIYNRFGDLVYSHGEGYTNQWNGTSNNGKILPSGTYMYAIQSINGPKTGWVEIIRETR